MTSTPMHSAPSHIAHTVSFKVCVALTVLIRPRWQRWWKIRIGAGDSYRDGAQRFLQVIPAAIREPAWSSSFVWSKRPVFVFEHRPSKLWISLGSESNHCRTVWNATDNGEINYIMLGNFDRRPKPVPFSHCVIYLSQHVTKCAILAYWSLSFDGNLSG